MVKEFQISKMMGLHAQTQNSVALIQGQSSYYVACIGAGAAILPLNPLDTDNAQERFFYTPPIPGTGSPLTSPRTSPRSSPTLKPIGGRSPGSSTARLVRVNRSHCLDVCATRNALVVGESGGYLPRLILYDFTTGNAMDVLRDQHPFGIQFLKFSPSGEYLASLGTPQDGYIYIWSIQNGKFELKSSNRCISEVRDLIWLNDFQVVTVGVRHVKIWTVEPGESMLNGRNVILGTLADQAFDCALPLRLYGKAEFLVGTQSGAVYSLPDGNELITETGTPIKSLCFANEAIYVSSVSGIRAYGIREYDKNAPFNEAIKEFHFGSPALYTHGLDVFCIESNKHFTRLRKLDGDNTSQESCPKHMSILYQKGLQLRSTRMKTILCWKSDDSSLVRWPAQVVKTGLKDITVADEAGPSSLLVGSLSGDIRLGDQIISAHNGPISDVHVYSSELAISSGRDRTVQIWCRKAHKENFDSKNETFDVEGGDKAAGTPWSLRQTLVFPTPILRARICANADGNMALVCCGANKTLYCYKTEDGPISCDDDAKPAFMGSPRTILIKAMPYDIALHGNYVILSTNDKVITVLDPFSAHLVSATWRPTDSYGDLINLTHIDTFSDESDEGSVFLLGTSSNKSIVVYDLKSGNLLASLWGFGEPISGLASNATDIVGSSDVLLVSQLKEADLSDSAVPVSGIKLQTASSDLTQPPPLQLPRLHLSDENMRRASAGRVHLSDESSTSPVRRVFGPSSSSVRSRSVSPIRSTATKSISNSATNARTGGLPPRIAQKSTSHLAEKSGTATTDASRLPLRLSSGSSLATQNLQTTPELSRTLRAFVNSEQTISDSERSELKKLLVAALNKIDESALFEDLASRLEARLVEKIDSLK